MRIPITTIEIDVVNLRRIGDYFPTANTGSYNIGLNWGATALRGLMFATRP